MKAKLKHSIFYGLALIVIVTLVVITAACSSTSSLATSPTTMPTITPPNLAQSQGVNGTLAGINGNTLTLTTADGQVIVNVDSGTIIERTVNGALSDLSQGEFVTIIGTTDSSGDISATSIIVQPEGQGGQFTLPTRATPGDGGGFARPSNSPGNGFPNGGTRRPSAVGNISGINGDTLTVTTAQGQVTVNVDSNTLIQKTTIGTLSDLSVGDSLTVSGMVSSNGAINAASIMVQLEGQNTAFSPTPGE
jgi:hypothetical protein